MMTKREKTHWKIMKNRNTNEELWRKKKKQWRMLKKRGQKKQWTMMKNSGKIRTHDEK